MSFTRRRARAHDALPPGVRASPLSGALVTSSGLRALDAALGGGLALGALTIVAQDRPSSFYVALAAYGVAQAVVCAQPVCVLSMDRSADAVLHALPALSGEDARAAAERERPPAVRADELRIAWRYGAAAAAGARGAPRRAEHTPFVSDFDLGRRGVVPPSAHVETASRLTSPRRVLAAVKAHLERARARGALARVVLTGVSPALATRGEHEPSLAEMVAKLRALARLYGAVVVVMCAGDVPERLQCVLSDACLKIDSFGGKGTSVAGLGSEWMGVLIVKKAYREGRSGAFRGVGDVWVFKRGRRKYTMERATAAPDEEQVRGDQEKTASAGTVCSSNPSDLSLQF